MHSSPTARSAHAMWYLSSTVLKPSIARYLRYSTITFLLGLKAGSWQKTTSSLGSLPHTWLSSPCSPPLRSRTRICHKTEGTKGDWKEIERTLRSDLFLFLSPSACVSVRRKQNRRDLSEIIPSSLFSLPPQSQVFFLLAAFDFLLAPVRACA